MDGRAADGLDDGVGLVIGMNFAVTTKTPFSLSFDASTDSRSFSGGGR